ncbi:MAG: cyclohexanone monooxygenase, partial [Alphaproteobacteria bacterium]
VPLETHYLEAYNRDNVRLVDVNETPIERITKTGVRTSAEDFDFDLIVYATGFDAITGAYDRIDLRGAGGMRLRDKWREKISTYLGIFIHGCPNLLMPNGPQSGSASTNFPRGIEVGVDWCTAFLEHVWANGITRFDATEAAEARWTQHVTDMYAMMLMRKAKSWFTGYNSNVEGHEAGTIRYLVYNGGMPKYVSIIEQVAADGYEGVALDRALPQAAAGAAPMAGARS